MPILKLTSANKINKKLAFKKFVLTINFILKCDLVDFFVFNNVNLMLIIQGFKK